MDSKTILVVDDDEMTRVLLGQVLQAQRHKVIEASDGGEALALFMREVPDLVLLDVDLPKLNGFELCQLIRDSEAGREIPVVMITGMDDTASIEQAYKLGATDFMVKPLNWSLVGHHLRYVMRASSNYLSLKESERRLEHAQQIARLGYWELDHHSDCLLISRQVMQMFSLPGTCFQHGFGFFLQLVHPAERMHVKNVLNRALHDEQPFHLDLRLQQEGQTHYVHLQGQCEKHEVRGELELPGKSETKRVLSGVMQDISELKRSQKQLTHVAHHDNLTGLPNRILFQQQLERALDHAAQRDSKVALLFIDLDRFKNINDSLGHDVGDALLRDVSQRIKREIRNHDDTIARLGGDEFAIILDSVDSEQHAINFAERIIAFIEQPFIVNGKVLYIGASIGISLFPDHGTSPETLLRNADTAMYQAKRSEQRQHVLYSGEHTEATVKRWSLENELRQALEDDSFNLLYQPKVDLTTGRIVSVEALLRWRKPPPIVSPAEFIPIAEETGLIIPLGMWVIEQAIRQLVAWRGTACESLSIAVNVSGRQLFDRDLVGFIGSELSKQGISPELLELEITEEYLIPDSREGNCLQTVQALHDLGLHMAIDDFGTGYSSLSQLKGLPISSLKIDKSFVDHVPGSNADLAIIKSIISLARNLGLQVIAEGVETSEQLAFLKQNDCDLVQGFYYSPPVTAEQILAKCNSSEPLEPALSEP